MRDFELLSGVDSVQKSGEILQSLLRESAYFHAAIPSFVQYPRKRSSIACFRLKAAATLSIQSYTASGSSSGFGTVSATPGKDIANRSQCERQSSKSSV